MEHPENENKIDSNTSKSGLESKRVLAGVCGVLLGSVGLHKFVLGYNAEGLIQILITMVTCGVGSFVGFVEGIIYLTKSDEDFIDTYQKNKRPWF